VPMVKAMNLVTTMRASDIALAAPSSAGRMLTLVPWRGRARRHQPVRTGAARDGVVTAGEWPRSWPRPTPRFRR
jgi:hypothetical protein